VVEDFTSATFADRVGESFLATPADGPPFELVVVASDLRDGGERPASMRAPFSVVFAARDGHLARQQLFTFEHRELGTFTLFLVPIGPDGEAMQYEAVFA
jgi:hypothetical protein